MKKTFVLLTISVALFIYYSSSEKSEQTVDETIQEDSTETNHVHDEDHQKDHSQTVSQTKKTQQPTSSPAKTHSNSSREVDLNSTPHTESEALASLSRALYVYSSPKEKKTKEDLIENLEIWSLAPTLAEDSNPYTGTMSIVRTQKTLPGSRYIHAQYFSSEDGSQVLQHFSFEVRPGEGQFERVVAQVRENFSITSIPVAKRSGYVAWSHKGQSIWVKEMSASDIKNEEHNPFNAYSKKDIGTIRVAVEIDPHDGDGDHSHISN